jgi:hypothetical protein
MINNERIYFIGSDASLKEDKTIIIAFKDYYLDKIYQQEVKRSIQNSLRAEEIALRYAIKYAINKGYKHCVFVYDCLAINSNKFLKRYSKYFKTIQFLWVKREYISEIDIFTKQLETKESIELKSLEEEELDILILKALTKYINTKSEAKVFKKLFPEQNFSSDKENGNGLLILLYHIASTPLKKRLKRVFKECLSPLELRNISRKRKAKDFRGILKEYNITDRIVISILNYKNRNHIISNNWGKCSIEL